MKSCNRCKKTKSILDFHKNKKSKDGKTTICKVCRNNQGKKYRFLNKDKSKKYYEINKEKIIIQVIKNAKNNIDATRANKRKYYNKNKNLVIKRAKQWGKDNADRRKKISKNWDKNNLEKKRESCRKRRAKEKNLNEIFTSAMEEATRSCFDNKCAKCNGTQNICIDHHLPLSRGYPLSASNAVLLCRSCNSKKSNKLPQDFYTKEEYIKIEKKLITIMGWYEK